MKPSNLIIVTLLSVSTLYAQKQNNIWDKLYLKGGIEFSGFKNSDINKKGIGEYSNVIGSVLFDYNDQVQFEVMYKYGFDIYRLLKYSYTDTRVKLVGGGVVTTESVNEIIHSNSVFFKTNYFLNLKKTHNPVYLTGGLILDVQSRLKNGEINVSTYYMNNNYDHEFISQVYNDYNRVLTGAFGGAGIFLAFGRLNLQIEFSAAAKIAPFVDRGYKEFLYNISFSPVFKF